MQDVRLYLGFCLSQSFVLLAESFDHSKNAFTVDDEYHVVDQLNALKLSDVNWLMCDWSQLRKKTGLSDDLLMDLSDLKASCRRCWMVITPEAQLRVFSTSDKPVSLQTWGALSAGNFPWHLLSEFIDQCPSRTLHPGICFLRFLCLNFASVLKIFHRIVVELDLADEGLVTEASAKRGEEALAFRKVGWINDKRIVFEPSSQQCLIFA